MARTQHLSRGQIFAAILGAGIIILITPVLLGAAIQQRVIVPPQLDVQLGGLHLLATTSHAPDCDAYVTPCASDQQALAGQEFYVICVLIRPKQPASTKEWQTSTRRVVLPLRNASPETFEHYSR